MTTEKSPLSSMDLLVEKKTAHHILLVQPNAALADDIQTLLTGASESILMVPNAKEALASVHDTPPDLIVVDFVLPDMGAYEFCRAIRGLPPPYLPLIVLGRGQNTLALARALNEGADGYLHQPYDPDELRARVVAALRVRDRLDILERQTKLLREFTRSYQERNKRLVTLTHELEQRLSQEELTGIHSRSYFNHRVEEEVAKVSRLGGKLSCVRLRLAFFPMILERLGLRKADELLREIDSMFGQAIRAFDVPASLDRGEYAILLPETARDDADMLLNRLQERLFAMGLPGGPWEGIPLDCATGLANSPSDTPDPSEVLRLAEDQLERQTQELFARFPRDFVAPEDAEDDQE